MSVLVLMSVYNGEKYLSEQIESILKQQDIKADILIRDDGSSDGSKEILAAYSARHANITWYGGENLGVWKSFMDLVYRAEGEYDCYAFSDQDDVWLPDKLRAAVGKIAGMRGRYGADVPLQYACNICPVDEQLNKIRTGLNLKNYKISFGSAMVQGITSGHTCVFNRAALLKMREAHPQYMVMHDWWLFLVCSCFGGVYYDNDAYVLYRQHAGNVDGARKNRFERIAYRLKHFNMRRKGVPEQVRQFLLCYPDMPEKERKLAQLLCSAQHNYSSRVKLCFNRDIVRQRTGDNIVYKMLVLAGYM